VSQCPLEISSDHSLPLSEDFVTFLNGADVPPSQAGAGATYVVPSSDFGLSTDLIVRGNIASQICKMANLHRCTELTFKTWKMVVQPAGQTAKVDVDLP
jgi:hypothetical protein